MQPAVSGPSSKNRCVILAADHLKRYVETGTLPSEFAHEDAKYFVKQILLCHREPRVVVCGRDIFLYLHFSQTLFNCATLFIATSRYTVDILTESLNGVTAPFQTRCTGMLPVTVGTLTGMWNSHSLPSPIARRFQRPLAILRLLYSQDAAVPFDTLFPRRCDVNLSTSEHSASLYSHSEAAHQGARFLELQQRQKLEASDDLSEQPTT